MNFILDFHRLLEDRRSDIVLIQKSSSSQSILIKTVKKPAISLDKYPSEKEEKFLQKSQLLRRESVTIITEREKTVKIPLVTCGLKGLVVLISWCFPSAYRVSKTLYFKHLSHLPHFYNILTCKDTANTNHCKTSSIHINRK